MIQAYACSLTHPYFLHTFILFFTSFCSSLFFPGVSAICFSSLTVLSLAQPLFCHNSLISLSILLLDDFVILLCVCIFSFHSFLFIILFLPPEMRWCLCIYCTELHSMSFLFTVCFFMTGKDMPQRNPCPNATWVRILIIFPILKFILRGYMRSDMGLSSAAKKESLKWNRLLQDYEETRKDR